MPVLVAYATAHGSTRSIAERIAARLADAGVRPDVRPVGSVVDPRGYSAAVVGSAIHNGDWLPAASRFLTDLAPGLAGRPLWLFSVGLTPALSGRRGRWMAAHGQEPAAITAVRAVAEPRDVHLFGGVLEKSHLPPLSRPFVRAWGARFGDFRDWDAVDAWGRAIAAEVPRD